MTAEQRKAKLMLRGPMLMLTVLVMLLTGCDTVRYEYQQAQKKLKMPAETSAGVEVAAQPRLVTATGYAPVSIQAGATRNHKILNAMRASKLQAYKELAAIVHGQYLFGTTRIQDMALQNDQFNTAVGGIIRGARVVKTFPIQEDTYATILELDLNDVQRAFVSSQQ